MNGAKLILSVGICLGIAGAIASGCGGSSNNRGPGSDSGPSPDVSETDVIADAGGASCNPFRFDLCPADQTCCFSGLGGTCVPLGATCNAPFRVSCQNTPSCHDAGVCCAGLLFDAEALEAGGFTLSFSCENSCSFPEFQVCMTDNDCQNGRVCVNIAAPNRPTVLTCLPPDAGPDAGGELPDSSPAEGGGLADAAGGGADAGGDASDAGGDAPGGG
jgi:hypothetical protein